MARVLYLEIKEDAPFRKREKGATIFKLPLLHLQELGNAKVL